MMGYASYRVLTSGADRDDVKRALTFYGIQLAQDLCSTVGEPVLLAQPDAEWELFSGDTRWNEGPTVIRHDGRYYLFYSAKPRKALFACGLATVYGMMALADSSLLSVKLLHGSWCAALMVMGWILLTNVPEEEPK